MCVVFPVCVVCESNLMDATKMCCHTSQKVLCVVSVVLDDAIATDIIKLERSLLWFPIHDVIRRTQII